MSLDIRALISAHAGESSALNVAHVNLRLAKALRTSAPCGLLAQELKRCCGFERLSRGSSPKRKATA
jgi:hypothetical protein